MIFDSKAKDWDKDPKKVERAAIFAGEILKVIGDEKLYSAVEFGSGTGLVSFQLKDKFGSITLADTSRGMMEVLEEKIKREKLNHFKPLLINDTRDLAANPETDVLFTLLTLHHVKDIDIAFKVFGKLVRMGGYLFIGDLVTEDGSFHYKDPDFDGHPGFDTAVLKEKLKNAGFECIAEKIILSVMREPGGVKKNFPLFMLALKKK